MLFRSEGDLALDGVGALAEGLEQLAHGGGADAPEEGVADVDDLLDVVVVRAGDDLEGHAVARRRGSAPPPRASCSGPAWPASARASGCLGGRSRRAARRSNGEQFKEMCMMVLRYLVAITLGAAVCVGLRLF